LAVLVPAACLLMTRAAVHPPVAFAIAGVAARLWTYHKTYDDLIVGFVLVALARVAVMVSGRRKLVAAALFLLVGASLWVPPRVGATELFRPAKLVAWLAGVAGVVVFAREPEGIVPGTAARHGRPVTT